MSGYAILKRCQLAIIISSLLTGSALAGESTQSSNDDSQQTLTVVATPGAYGETESVSATKTSTPITENPQSVQVINRKMMDEQASHTLMYWKTFQVSGPHILTKSFLLSRGDVDFLLKSTSMVSLHLVAPLRLLVPIVLLVRNVLRF